MIFPILFPYILIIPTIFIIYQIIQKLYPEPHYRFAVAFFLSPVLLGMIQFYLFTFYPKKPSLFYLLFFVVLILISSILTIIKRPIQIPKMNIKQIFRSQPIVVVLSLIIILLTIIHACLWPINWKDQLLYLNQTYVYWQTKDASALQMSAQIKTDDFDYTMTPSIRPLMPMIFSFYYFTGNQLLYSQFYAQSIIAYFFISVILLLLFRQNYPNGKINYKQNLFSVFFVLTCFDFINFTIFGFKELVIIGLLLISLDLIAKLKFVSYKLIHLLFFGFVLASLAAVNYSGTVIGGMLLITAYVFSQGNFFNKISLVVVSFILMGALSLGEPNIFFSWVLKGITTDNTAIGVTQSIISNINGGQSTNNHLAQSELSGYKIDLSLFDYYLKGKLQAFTQIQFYGLLFWYFLISIFFYTKKYLTDPSSKILLFFAAIYCFAIFDPLNINPNIYAYVLSISHKYTLIILPVIAILFSQNIDKLTNIFRRISYKVIFFLLILTSIAASFVYLFLYQHVTQMFLNIVPIFRTTNYYSQIVRDVSLTVALFSIFCALLIIIIQRNNRRFSQYWRSHNISLAFLFVVPTFFLFAIPFQTNFGFINTIVHASASMETKLEKIRGNENYFQSIVSTKNLIGSKISTENKVFFIDLNMDYASFYLRFKPSDILIPSSDSQTTSESVANPTLRYILTSTSWYTNNRKLFHRIRIIYQNPDYILLEKQ